MPATWTTPKNWNVGELLIASDLNTHVRDNLEWLKARPFAYQAIATTTTTSTSYVAVTGGSVSLATVGGNVLIACLVNAANSGAGNGNFFDLAIDSTRQGDASNGLGFISTPVSGYYDLALLLWMTCPPPSAGSHSYALYWKTTAGTITLNYARLFVMEVR